MRKVIAKLPSHLLHEEENKRELSFLFSAGFVKQTQRPYHLSSPEAYPAKEYAGLLTAVLNHSVYIRGFRSEINICSRDLKSDARCTDDEYFFSYREPSNSIHIIRNRVTNNKNKTIT